MKVLVLVLQDFLVLVLVMLTKTNSKSCSPLPPTVYSVSDYHKHVPVQIRNAIPAFKDKFFNKHTSAPQLLRKEHIAVTFVTFKCNFELRMKEDVDDHFEDVHGIVGGATRLLPFLSLIHI